MQRAGRAKSLPSMPELQAPLPSAAIKTWLYYFSCPYRTSSGMTAPICCEERDEYLGIRRPRSYADQNSSFPGSPCTSQVAAAGDRTQPHIAPHLKELKLPKSSNPLPGDSPIPAGLGRGDGTKPNARVNNSPCHQAGLVYTYKCTPGAAPQEHGDVYPQQTQPMYPSHDYRQQEPRTGVGQGAKRESHSPSYHPGDKQGS